MAFFLELFTSNFLLLINIVLDENINFLDIPKYRM